jgi:hypothetical protein
VSKLAEEADRRNQQQHRYRNEEQTFSDNLRRNLFFWQLHGCSRRDKHDCGMQHREGEVPRASEAELRS